MCIKLYVCVYCSQIVTREWWIFWVRNTYWSLLFVASFKGKSWRTITNSHLRTSRSRVPAVLADVANTSIETTYIQLILSSWPTTEMQNMCYNCACACAHFRIGFVFIECCSFYSSSIYFQRLQLFITIKEYI